MIDRDKSHVTAGWNADHDLRWIEVGRLRFEEARDGASCAIIRAPGSAGPTFAQVTLTSTWLSASELAGLVQHLSRWFYEDPAEVICQIETCATYVKRELETWNARARIDEEHPPYDALTRVLDELLVKSQHLRERSLFGEVAEHPKKATPSALPATISSEELALLLHDAEPMLHPAFAAFRRQMRGRVYSEERLNDAWTYFKQGWADGNGDGE